MPIYKVKILFETQEFTVVAVDDMAAREEAKDMLRQTERMRKHVPETLKLNKVVCVNQTSGRKVPVKV